MFTLPVVLRCLESQLHKICRQMRFPRLLGLPVRYVTVFEKLRGKTTQGAMGSPGNDLAIKSMKEKFLGMPLEQKRKLYNCSKYVTIQDIQPFTNGADSIGSKISIWQGDITTLEIDVIVNAANSSLRGGGGVDGAIHRAAGGDLTVECSKLGGCHAGHAKITGGYKLPAKYVIHTVGPMGEKPDILLSCYKSCFDLMMLNNLRTIAFPCIATGVYGYPNERAVHVALKAAKEFLEAHNDEVDRVIFCVFLPVDVKLYQEIVPKYFLHKI